MSQRFFVSEPVAGKMVSLGGDEGHHLARVMRAQPGERVVLFDNSGAEFEACITSVGRSTVELEVLERRPVDREAAIAVSLGVALPKGERQRFLVEKAVELGVARLVALETERGVAQPTASALERLRRAVVEASKQCGRNRLMEVAPATPLAEYVASAPTDALRLIAHPGGRPLAAVFGAAETRVCVAVGPEGGFSEKEFSAAVAAGWQAVDLGPRILRVETAALAIAAWAALVGGKV